MSNKRLYKSVERWINQWYAPDDTIIEVKSGSRHFRPKPPNTSAKYDEKLFDRLDAMIDGALYFTMDMEERRKGIRRFRK